MISYIRASPIAVTFGLFIGLLAMLALPGVMDYGREQYEKLRPVIADWKVVEARAEQDDLVLHGTMLKTRDCLLVPPVIARDTAGQSYILESEARWQAKDASDEKQTWGPWRVRGAVGKKLKFLMVYICSGNTPTVIAVGTYPK